MGGSLKAMAATTRQRLDGDMLLYVSAAGDDDNSGLTPGQAIRTLNEFYRRVRSTYDLAGHQLRAQLADGEYLEDEITCVAATVGAVQVFVQGNEGDPNAVRIRCGAGKKLFYSRDLGITTLRNLTLGTTGAHSCLVNVTTFSTIDLDAVWFEAAPNGIHILVCQGFLVVQNDYCILGGASRHLSTSDNGVVYYGGFTVEIPRPVSFDDFVVAETGALVSAGGMPMKFTGNGVDHCTGRKFHVAHNGLLLSSGTDFPGDRAGIGSAVEAMLAEERKRVVERDLLLAQKNTLLQRQEALLSERDNMVAEQKQLLAQKDAALVAKDEALVKRDATLTAMQKSRSWRMTAPLRNAVAWLRR